MFFKTVFVRCLAYSSRNKTPIKITVLKFRNKPIFIFPTPVAGGFVVVVDSTIQTFSFMYKVLFL